MKHKKILALWMAAALTLGGCGEPADMATGMDIPDHFMEEHSAELSEPSGNQEGNEPAVSGEVTALNPEDLFSDRDLEAEYEESESVVITLNGSSAQCNSDRVEIKGSTVTIKDEGTYILSGSLEDGMIVVNTDKEDKIQLVLNGVNIHSKTCAPIYIVQSDKVFITLAEGSENTLSNGGSFVAIDDNEVDGVIFSKEDVTLNGAGALSISSPAGHGIVSKDELTLTGGAYSINCESHGLSGKDSVAIANASCQITSGKDGVHGENKDDSSLGYVYIQSSSLAIEAKGDGISAESLLQIESGSFAIDSVEDSIHANGSVLINDGTFAVASEDDGVHADETLAINGGSIHISESYEGLEALHVQINGGTISLVAEDDGINAAGGMDSSGFGGKGGRDHFGGRGGRPFGGGMEGDMRGEMGGEKPDRGMPGGGSGSVTITGGDIYVKASGDGIDANGTLSISGGNVVVCGPNHGDTATLDYDTTGVITGGTFIGSGASGMAQTFSDAQQGVVAVKAGNIAAGTEIVLADQSGKVLLTASPELDFSMIILSSPNILSGETYALTVGTDTQEYVAK